MVSQYANDNPLDPTLTNAPIALPYAAAAQQTPAPAPKKAPVQQSTINKTPPPPEPEQDTGTGGGGLVDRWNSFIDHPENRAGMMQFAVNMLSGRGLGESVGAAAEASSRNIASQEERQKYEAEQEFKEQEAERKARETEYYGIGQQRKSAADTYYEKADYREQQRLDRENRAAWDSWMKDPLARAGILDSIRKKYPGVKSKDDLDKEENRAAREEAQRMLLGGRLGQAGPAPREFQAPQGAVVRYDKNGNKIYYDPKTKQPYPGQI